MVKEDDLVGDKAEADLCRVGELADTLVLVGEVFNNEGEAGPSSVLALLLPTRLLRAPLKVLILENI